jgi:hypothetical protein
MDNHEQRFKEANTRAHYQKLRQFSESTMSLGKFSASPPPTPRLFKI